jgi:hypothetical protein
MQPQTINKFRWFWAWQDEAEEAWLAEMSSKGYHLQTSHGLGFYTFTCGEPANYTYRLDYLAASKQEAEVYYQLFADAGWEFIGAMAGWQYFRIPTPPGEEPEIYSDPQSKVRKYERLVGTLVIFLPITTVFFVVWDGSLSPYIGVPLTLLMAGVIVLYVVAMLKLFQRINQLKRL